MWSIKPPNSTNSRALITQDDPMKCAARLNISPLSFSSKMGRSAKMHAFNPTWMIKNEMRKSPVRAITNFLPTDDVKNSDHFIECMFCLWRCAWGRWKLDEQVQPIRKSRVLRFYAKIAQQLQKPTFAKNFLVLSNIQCCCMVSIVDNTPDWLILKFLS